MSRGWFGSVVPYEQGKKHGCQNSGLPRQYAHGQGHLCRVVATVVAASLAFLDDNDVELLAPSPLKPGENK